MIVSIEIHCDNAAFDNYPEEEVARILRDAADRIIGRGLRVGDSRNLADYNGNVVGSIVVGAGHGHTPALDVEGEDEEE